MFGFKGVGFVGSLGPGLPADPISLFTADPISMWADAGRTTPAVLGGPVAVWDGSPGPPLVAPTPSERPVRLADGVGFDFQALVAQLGASMPAGSVVVGVSFARRIGPVAGRFPTLGFLRAVPEQGATGVCTSFDTIDVIGEQSGQPALVLAEGGGYVASGPSPAVGVRSAVLMRTTVPTTEVWLGSARGAHYADMVAYRVAVYGRDLDADERVTLWRWLFR